MAITQKISILHVLSDVIYIICACCSLNLLETVANVDETLGEMFLEEVQPTEEQLIVRTS